jgi:RNA polymerase sigma-70 factor (ECF subfamily)
MTSVSDEWTDWFDRHAAAMLLLARQRVPSRADAEDVVQEAFLRFWPLRRRVTDARAYLYRCVRRCAADLHRKRGRRRAREHLAAMTATTGQEPLFQRDSEVAELQDRIEGALRRLPTEQREVLVLKIWAGLTFAQVAAVLDVSPNTIAARYRYALNALRPELAEEVVL